MDRKRTGLGERIAPYTQASDADVADADRADGDPTASRLTTFPTVRQADASEPASEKSVSTGGDPEPGAAETEDRPASEAAGHASTGNGADTDSSDQGGPAEFGSERYASPAGASVARSISVVSEPNRAKARKADPGADGAEAGARMRLRSSRSRPKPSSATTPARSQLGPRNLLIWTVAAAAVVGLIALVVMVVDGGDSGVEGVGPARVESGVPSGFSHSREGAREAALQYVSLTGTPLMNDPDAYRNAAEAIASPEAQDEWTTGAERALQAFGRARKALGIDKNAQIVFKLYPLADSVVGYEDDSALVKVWAMSLLAADGTKARTSFVTYTVTLDWIDGDWKGSKLSVSTAANPRETKGLTDALTKYEHIIDRTSNG